VQQVEIAFAPVGGGKAQPSDESKQQNENYQRGPVDVLHDIPPSVLVPDPGLIYPLVFSRKINNRGKRGADDYPKQLIPVEERHTDPRGFDLVVEGWPKYGDKLDEKEQIPPAPTALLLT
jgi:hypothetical protein